MKSRRRSGPRPAGRGVFYRNALSLQALFNISLVCLSVATSLPRLEVAGAQLQTPATPPAASDDSPAATERVTTALEQQQQQQTVQYSRDDASITTADTSGTSHNRATAFTTTTTVVRIKTPPAVIGATSATSTTSTALINNNNNNKTTGAEPQSGQSRTTRAVIFRPPPLLETTTTARPAGNFIARTSDAIIKTLSGYFSHEDNKDDDDDDASPEERTSGFGAKITRAAATTTSAPPTPTWMTTKWPELTSTGRRTTTRITELQAMSTAPIPATNLPVSMPVSQLASTWRPLPPSTLAPSRLETTTSSPRLIKTTVAHLWGTSATSELSKSSAASTSFTKTFVTAAPHLDLGTYHDDQTTAPGKTPTPPQNPSIGSTSPGPQASSQVTRQGTQSTPANGSPLGTNAATAPPQRQTTAANSVPNTIVDTTTPQAARRPLPDDQLKIAPFAGAQNATKKSSLELFDLLGNAIKSLESTFLTSGNKSRSTRVAPLNGYTADSTDQGEREGVTGEATTPVSPVIMTSAAAAAAATTTTTTTTSARATTSRAPQTSSKWPVGAIGKLVQSATTSAQEAPTTTTTSGDTAGKQQVSTREDILLLCKLLHKHLESSKQNENGSITFTLDSGALAANLTTSKPGSSGLRATSATPTSSVSRPSSTTQPEVPLRGGESEGTQADSLAAGSVRLISDPRSELSELQHEDRLLESTFALDQSRRPPQQQRQNRSHEMAAEQLLYDLYNLAHKRKRARQQQLQRDKSAAEGDESAAPAADEETQQSGADTPISLRVWSRTTTGGAGSGATGGRLKLVYWLLEQVSAAAPRDSAKQSKLPRFRVLDFRAASELLDELDHALVQQRVDELALVRPIALLAPHRKRDDASESMSPAPPLVIDDTLSAPGSGGAQSPDAASSRTALQLLVDRLSQASFSDNIYLYLILFIILLFVIIMCFAVPALCCKCMLPEGSGATSAASLITGGSGGALSGGARGRRRAAQNRRRPPPGEGRWTSGDTGDAGAHLADSYNSTSDRTKFKSADPLRESISSISGAIARARGGNNLAGTKQHPNGDSAIWRKLSNSTTTLTKDQVRSLEHDGQLGPRRPGDEAAAAEPVDDLMSGGIAGARGSGKFEWYTFEDKQTLRKTTKSSKGGGGGATCDKPVQTLVVHDQRKVTKSIQTYSRSGSHELSDDGDAELPKVSATSGAFNDSIDREQLSLAYRDRLETRNSDTLTKSELVMLKEKLIPIGRELRAQAARPQPARQQVSASLGAAAQSHDYINTASQRPAPPAPPPSQASRPARHIDSSLESAETGATQRSQQRATSGSADDSRKAPSRADEGQRAPSMRYLELPASMQGQLDAIRDELGRIESRDADMSTASRTSCRAQQVPADAGGLPERIQKQHPSSGGGTYKRYDVI